MHPYLELFKARLSGLVTATTAVGFLLGSASSPDWAVFLFTLIGTGLSAGGANALNQYEEIRRDACMNRTKARPLPSGRMRPRTALLLGLGTAIGGVALLALTVNWLTAGLSALVVLLYTLVYTPLKHRTPLCTLVGAVCGAIPPIMGWTGATGTIGFGAWILAAILFFWQIPHFLALAWLYREDYERGGYRMLPSIDPSGQKTSILAVLYSLPLLPIGIAATVTGLAGWAFAAGSLLFGGGLVYLGLRLYHVRDQRNARRLFLGSLLYLPLVLGLMVVDRGPGRGIQDPGLAALSGRVPEARVEAQLRSRPPRVETPRGETDPATERAIPGESRRSD